MATVIGLFDNRDNAQTAIEQLRAGGIEPNKIGVAMHSREDTSAMATDTGVTTGAVTGAVGGGVLGGLAGLLVGTGLLAIPGLGPIAAGGWLLTTLTGAGIGAATGGLVGALVDAGIPEEEARMYQAGVERGGVLVTAQVPDGQENWARDVLSRSGARDVRGDYTNFYNNPNFRYGTGTYGTTTGTEYPRTT